MEINFLLVCGQSLVFDVTLTQGPKVTKGMQQNMTPGHHRMMTSDWIIAQQALQAGTVAPSVEIGAGPDQQCPWKFLGIAEVYFRCLIIAIRVLEPFIITHNDILNSFKKWTQLI